jgi:hypothetical protein
VRNENGPAPLAQGDAGPENFAAAKPLGSVVESTAIGDISSRSAGVAVMPLRWANQLIANADSAIPEYGSPEWQQLPDDSRAKVAACVIAAEEWRTCRSAGYAPVSFTSRRVREIAKARRPRPGDYTGGPVEWERTGGAG